MRRGDIKGTQQFKKNSSESKTFQQLFDEFYLSLQVRGRAEDTLRSYRYHNKYFMAFLGKNIYCQDITLKTLEDYVLYIQNVKKIDNNITINSYLRNISPILKYGFKKGYIKEDFIIPVLKEQETFKEIYTEGEMKLLLSKPKNKNFTTIRTWAIIWTFASTGIRARELRELQVKNVDLLNRTIAVNKTKNKKARYLPISNSLAEVFEEYLPLRKGDAEDYLFPTVYNEQLGRTSLQKSIKIYCTERGIGKSSLHLFRHTFITVAVNKNVSPLILKQITGHSSMKELNRYYNAKTSDMINIIDEIAPNLKKKESVFKKKK